MKRVFFIGTILSVCILLEAGSVFPQLIWRQVSQGIAEHDFRTLLIHPSEVDTLFVGTEKALYQSKDAGKSWRRVLNVQGEDASVHFLTSTPHDPKRIFAATGNGLYRTVDGGETWEKLFEGIGISHRTLSVLLDREDNSRIYLGTAEGLFTSQDGGRHFNRNATRLSNLAVVYLNQDPSDSKRIFAVTSEGLYRSADRGETWERLFAITPTGESAEGELQSDKREEGSEDDPRQPTVLLFSPENTSHLFLGTSKGLYHSRDSGQSWERFTEIGLASSDIRHLVFQDSTLLAATAGGIYSYSEKEGRWQRAREGFLTEKARFLATGPRGDLWAVMEEGLYVGEGFSFSRPLEFEREARDFLGYFSYEPTIHEIQQAAIRYAEVHPEKIVAWRRAATRKAWLPTLSTGARMDIDRNVAVDTGGTTNPDFFITGPNKKGFNWDVGASWDLGKLLWNDDQTSIDARSRLMVQLRDDVLDEVTRLYFERRRLQTHFLIFPPNTLQEEVERQLKLQELTADIDALTDGYLSAALDKNSKAQTKLF